ncbi:Rieske 2Fe-2S domain-containing protein [Elizabethkingia anophelis]|uniref:aromatic ring-hydroxylating oxygenase subunit alpha n=1 Tax=Elizabethkingia TaxID=308865 RepID=UPI0007398A85|nr:MULTISPECIES: SRPBCC family protein [Elizabethkingia]KUF46333.1 Rieske (2Fe-2S) protein [Elizabethkingia anophelis]MCT3643484.1 Rieske 2Fe-2S domain-containing protein [Elizabethkingia anophelis]MCT3650264.1 Rieske 2Fe-2S domain-containing protein [Elizabethkingia anophelis]MCT3653881.1 Rieske 2Fe-2S domain-containing protein [Elizabethkingia anophelis]MCT3657738.1 Rieske 2Fe-2S domain-containing protein [Elizabethkingia anophelis]
MIKNINYTDNCILDEEFKEIFHSGWFYVGLTDKLTQKNDYITYKCGNVSIFVQNFGDSLKCFSNICLHRFNSIHLENEGNGHLICSYHNWVYDEDGKPMVRSACLQEELEKCERRKLEEYEVEVCGRFVFVKINKDNTTTLENQLGSFYDRLLQLSLNFDRIINDDIVIMDHKANWKLLVENVLECYHCSSVHKETLVPIGIGAKKPENHLYDNGNDKIDYPMRITASQKEREEKLTFFNKTLYSHKSLQHWYIFPNLFITSTAGNLFYIGKLTPRKGNFTQLHAQFMMPTYTDLSKKEEMLLKAYATTSIDSSKKVIFEDREILETIQTNLYIVPEEAQIFGEEEFRIQAFHEKIKNIINYK